MKLISFPYRWLLRTVFKNIGHIYWDLKNGIGNLVTFFEAVWWFRSWDWTGMVSLLEVSAREMRGSIEVNTVKHVRWERDARQLLIVESLCKRLRDDDYFRRAGYNRKTWKTVPDFERTRIAQHSGYMAQQDAVYLGKILKNVQHWWN